MKLKTLKDFGILMENVGEFNYHKTKGVQIKNVRDIKLYSDENLKQEAIKWIIEEKKHIAEWHLPEKEGELPRSLTPPDVHIGLIDGFMKFFNITDKEVKDWESTNI